MSSNCFFRKSDIKKLLFILPSFYYKILENAMINDTKYEIKINMKNMEMKERSFFYLWFSTIDTMIFMRKKQGFMPFPYMSMWINCG